MLRMQRMSSTNAIARRHPERSSFEEGHHNVLCHRLRRHHTQCVIHEVVIGFAVILRRRSSQRVVSSASPSSHAVCHPRSGHRLRRHPSKKVITCYVICIYDESLAQFQQPLPNIPTKVGLSLGRFRLKE